MCLGGKEKEPYLFFYIERGKGRKKDWYMDKKDKMCIWDKEKNERENADNSKIERENKNIKCVFGREREREIF